VRAVIVRVKACVPGALKRRVARWQERKSQTPAARHEARLDASGHLQSDAGPRACIDASIKWLARAQDESTTADGGVARHYSLMSGWGASYPETTGYIIPTLLTQHAAAAIPDAPSRARRMLNWLVSIQLPCGGFQGGLVNAVPVVPVTFNTGQILLGLVEGYRRFGDPRYLRAMHLAAAWLRDSQDVDGCWRKHGTPFALPGDKAYETHVAWALFEADRVGPGLGYGEAGHRQVRWAMTRQLPNGWFRDCCLDDPQHPLTHTLGYCLRGLIEAYRHGNDSAVLESAVRLAMPLAKLGLRDNGFLPGRFDANWRPTVSWSCLTGAVQIAASWFDLYAWTRETTLLDAARLANQFVRRTVAIDGDANVRGGVKGSYPVTGDYGRYEYLNWAAKFFVDANIRELETNVGSPAAR